METNSLKISVVIPTLNEEQNIVPLVERLDCTLSQFQAYEIIIIDDHSTDNTIKVAESLSAKYPVRVFTKSGLKGKSTSLKEGFKYAKYDLIATIDADLQYPPEEIPKMVEKMLVGSHVIQSRRSLRKSGSDLRTLASKIFNYIFVRLLHGLNLDSQSALKVFPKNLLLQVQVVYDSPWTFDLEFLIKARAAGFRITDHEIVFEDRLHGESKLKVLQASYEIAWNALKLKFLPIKPMAIPNGYAFRGQQYITHSSLPHEISAIETFVPWQKILIASLFLFFGICVFFYPLTSAVILIGVLSLVYFLDVFFNLFLVLKSLLSPPEFKFDAQTLQSVDENHLPVYTILCPLYREAKVLPGFLNAIKNLDWPKDKLDVKLLLEEDDEETYTKALSLDMPSYVKVLKVPHSLPKTKPKACNYGLSVADGEYLVVYDAEDLPEPQQLKKAYLTFLRADPKTICLQAKLSYYNPNYNILTRLFTAEYSLWFDIILPGLQSINAYIPLGGTSNHFRTKDLLKLQGWDPFNVTEDCDLGARIFSQGYKTAIIDSTTYEEANSKLNNWLRQRSRWIKGYMQTYLVHMRHPIKFFKTSPIHWAIFQLVVGGKIVFLLINPILWLMTIAYFVLRSSVGIYIETLYPPWVFYIAATSLLVGNFLYLYYYMIGCARRGEWQLIKYVFFVPLYWLSASVAAIIALYQLITKPHYWEKTHHGLMSVDLEEFENALSLKPLEKGLTYE